MDTPQKSGTLRPLPLAFSRSGAAFLSAASVPVPVLSVPSRCKVYGAGMSRGRGRVMRAVLGRLELGPADAGELGRVASSGGTHSPASVRRALRVLGARGEVCPLGWGLTGAKVWCLPRHRMAALPPWLGGEGPGPAVLSDLGTVRRQRDARRLARLYLWSMTG